MNAFQKIYKTQAIVLKHIPLGEADYLLTLYTPDNGKIKAVARGSRKMKSKLGGHVEPLMHTSFVLSTGRNLDVVSQADVIDGFRSIREDIQSLNVALYMMELVDKITEENQSNNNIYKLMLDCMHSLAKDPSPTLLQYFQLKTIEYSGFRPELYNCVECSNNIEASKHRFSLDYGGVLCLNCKPSGMNILPLSLATLKVLRFFLTHDLSNIQKLRVYGDNLLELNRIIKNILDYILDREVKSSTFLSHIYEHID
jgi:DNA repair protein RecO (recombination protein O)